MLDLARKTKYHYPHVIEVVKQFEREKIIKPLGRDQTENGRFKDKEIILDSKGHLIRIIGLSFKDLDKGANLKNTIKDLILSLNKLVKKIR